MKGQKKLILERNWDVLIILDDCRYDYFEEEYGKYLSGGLEPIMSADFQTQNFFEEVFVGEDFHDTIVVSANPHVNSKGIGAFGADPLHADNIFWKVFDVWESGWDDNLGVVPPKPVTEEALKRKRLHIPQRTIVWYLQPHEPYLPLLDSKENDNNNGRSLKGRLFSFVRNGLLGNCVGDFYTKIPRKARFSIRDLLGFAPRLPQEVAQRKGIDTLRSAYRENLRIVLEEVSNLVSELRDDGSIVLTSDHGEALGENGEIGHKQMEVPWLEVDGVAR